MKILIVEDDQATSDTLVDWLGDEGVIPPPDIAGSACEASRKIDGKLDVMLLDLNLPDLRGEDLLRVIHSVWDNDPPFRIVILTAASDAYRRLTGLNVDAIVHKPIASLDDLMSALKGEVE